MLPLFSFHFFSPCLDCFYIEIHLQHIWFFYIISGLIFYYIPILCYNLKKCCEVAMNSFLILYVYLLLLFIIPSCIIRIFKKKSSKKSKNTYNYVQKRFYINSDYYLQTAIPFKELLKDSGRYGEYLIYSILSILPGTKRFLFNCYIPKDDGDLSEIDVIMFHESGVYVFESKNYSGWIFGSEKDFKWTQTLPGRSGSVTKSHFYNPIMQNEEHIKWMREYIGSHIPTPIYSYIVFGEHCTLKNLNVIDNKYHICKLDNLYNIVSRHIADNGIKFSKEYVDFLFIKFYPLTQRSDTEKMQHIEKINAKKSNWK